MAISTNQKPTIYRNLYENSGHRDVKWRMVYREGLTIYPPVPFFSVGENSNSINWRFKD